MRQKLIALRRLTAGRYHFSGYLVEYFPGDGWRWLDPDDKSKGGEWRSTRREATRDLMAHLGMALDDE